MWYQLFKFECKYHFKQSVFKLSFLLFLILGLFSALQGGFGSNEVYKNAPYVITNIVALFSLLTIFACTNFTANVLLRDVDNKMESVIFTTSIHKGTYFSVRLLALITAVASLIAATEVGIFLARFFASPEEIGTFNFMHFLQPFLIFGFPNIVFSTSILFSVAILTKSAKAIYATGIMLYILYMLASILGNSPLLATSEKTLTQENLLPFLSDPFALSSFFIETRNWSDATRNTALFPLKSTFLANRLLWSSISLLIIILSYKWFNFKILLRNTNKAYKSITTPKNTVYKALNVNVKSWKYFINTIWWQFKIECSSLFKHIPFVVMLVLWAFLFGIELKDAILHGPYGIEYFPTTGNILEEIRSLKFALILLVYFISDVVSREKSSEMYLMVYSTPVRNTTFWLAKFLTMVLVVFFLITINIALGIGLQIFSGYYNFELSRYLSLYYYSGVPIIIYTTLLIFVQSQFSNKYLGMMANMVVVLITVFASKFGITHYLLRFADTPFLQYSYFNKFGHYAGSFNWYMLYWTGFAWILGILAIVFWQRRTQISFKHKTKERFIGLWKYKYLIFIAISVSAASGSYIYYETNIRGSFKTAAQTEEQFIAYEKSYKKYASLPQPTIKSVHTQVDLFTAHAAYKVKGSYTLKNETNKAIDTLVIGIHPSVNTYHYFINNVKEKHTDPTHKVEIIVLSSALKPGAELSMGFSFEVIRNGFVEFDTENSLVKNGSYIELEKFVPQFGYNSNLEIEDRKTRLKAGLSEYKPYLNVDKKQNKIYYESIISTHPDQTIVTVGNLKRSWNTGNRKYFHYKTESPINFMFALSSATYLEKQRTVNGITLKLYYLKGQEANITSIFEGMKDALMYGEQHFAPYPYKQLIIAAIPHYKGAATAYPGIVFNSERINYLTNYSNPEKVNQSYAITAHEVAHQWWANVLTPSKTYGRAFLTESIAKYVEAVLIEKKFGKMYLSKYLKFDNYLYFANKDVNKRELPLDSTYNQPHVYYQKGGLALYTVKEIMGEQKLNKALSDLIETHKFPNNTATADDLIQILEKQALPAQLPVVKDLFRKTTFNVLQINLVSTKLLKNSKYETEVEVNLKNNDVNTGASYKPFLIVDVALFDKETSQWDRFTQPLHIQKTTLKNAVTRLKITTNKRPKSMAIDPYGYILDNNLDDNLADIKN